jgi:ribosomal-protein-alanine N-acetyltransferase
VQASLGKNGTAQIAYVLSSEHWRQGIGSAAVDAMLAELASRYGARAAAAILKMDNIGSRALLRKLRFTERPPAAVPRIPHGGDEIVMYKALRAHENPSMPSVPRVMLEPPSMRHAERFIAAVARSRALHRGWAAPPATRERFRTFVKRSRTESVAAHLLLTDEGEIAGVINISEIVRGAFCSGYLGYYAFVPYAGRGYLRAGLEAVLRRAFREYGLHRVEANIQPENERSKALVQSLGFACEGYSPRYLKIAGRWRDHERWALTIEDWGARRRRKAKR